MRFMIIRKADADTEAGKAPTRELAAAMMAYHAEMAKHLKILDGNGLHPTARGARVRFNNGKPLVLDGPFAETKELIAGYTLVEADSLEQVLEWAQRWPAECDGGDGLELEVRRVYEMADFGDVFDEQLTAQAGSMNLGGGEAAGVNLLSAPLWVQVALVAEALAVAWLTGRFGRRGLVWATLGSLVFWFLLAFVASWFVGRLEGGKAQEMSGILSGAVIATGRLALVAWPLLVAGAAAGAAVRWGLARR